MRKRQTLRQPKAFGFSATQIFVELENIKAITASVGENAKCVQKKFYGEFYQFETYA